MPKETFFDPRKPFESKRPETHEEWQARMGGEVLAVVRSGLYLDFSFLALEGAQRRHAFGDDAASMAKR